jgi:hypothetical protein
MTNDESHTESGRGYGRVVLQFIVTIVVLSVIGGFLSFEHASLGFTEFYAGVARLILLVVGVVTILALVQGPLRSRMQAREGPHFASAFSFFATLITLILAFLSLLAALSIPATSFFVAVGGIGIVVGFAVSTVTTNIISGAFMLTSFPIKIGQRIIITVNNQPGTITSISTLFMTVTTDAGARLIIPNAAIFQGMAFMLDVGRGGQGTTDSETLLGRPGDRVISTLYPYPATVKEVTRLTTKIVTDGGQVLTIPNQAILNGNSALIKIQAPDSVAPTLPISVGDEVRLSAGGFAGKVTEVGPYYFRVSNDEEEVLVPITSLTSGGISVFKRKSTAAETGTRKSDA